MALGFPANPTVNQLVTINGVQWKFDGYGWNRTGSSVAGANPTIYLTTSRLATASDNFSTLELANGVTYTLTDTVGLSGGLILMGPVTGTATLAASGVVTMNGTTSPITISSGAVYSIIPRGSNPNAYVVSGG